MTSVVTSLTHVLDLLLIHLYLPQLFIHCFPTIICVFFCIDYLFCCGHFCCILCYCFAYFLLLFSAVSLLCYLLFTSFFILSKNIFLTYFHIANNIAIFKIVCQKFSIFFVNHLATLARLCGSFDVCSCWTVIILYCTNRTLVRKYDILKNNVIVNCHGQVCMFCVTAFCTHCCATSPFGFLWQL